ncbi:helix-turn-helix domain-containing protein [Clostridium tertium]|jgi:transcriptional regulator with XRE-family HTH domain|uniref:helix-turn-helix domain-containing protein n=1 Tax=Clostridium tertium TaxID=1559 RepID=UPI00115B27D8|nr:helix-turn-helix transcriptional regulator [Clostridium tertium]MDB1933929.1 helix-turn-helix domain-containing protein [Clostridium tertium]MDB1936554.1 helix-turn-helix domain-containing protein [Clostridium tertium]MDY4604844.1 helix-turn-helix domain-containing protein [Clostridium tertium]
MFNKDIIIKILSEKGWSRYKLCKEANMAQSTLSDILGGKNVSPKTDTLQRIADALNVPVSTFFDSEETNDIEKPSIKEDFPVIPTHFTDPEEARTYVMKHKIFGYGGFNPSKMCDDDILNFANEMINQAELLGIKYSMKNKDK